MSTHVRRWQMHRFNTVFFFCSLRVDHSHASPFRRYLFELFPFRRIFRYKNGREILCAAKSIVAGCSRLFHGHTDETRLDAPYLATPMSSIFFGNTPPRSPRHTSSSVPRALNNVISTRSGQKFSMLLYYAGSSPVCKCVHLILLLASQAPSSVRTKSHVQLSEVSLIRILQDILI